MTTAETTVIHAYCDAQAVQDDEAIEPNPETAREAGYHLPVILTRRAYEHVVEWTRPGDEWMQSEDARFWDVLNTGRAAAKAALNQPGDPFGFRVARIPNKTPSGQHSKSQLPMTVTLAIRIEPHNFDLNPCLVISIPGED